jgi:hypothetical protein
MARTSQEERILNLLAAAWPDWTPAPTLSGIALAYGRVIFNLPKQGWKIANRVTVVGGIRHGAFRLGDHPFPRSSELRATLHKATDPKPASPFPPPASSELFDVHQEPD